MNLSESQIERYSRQIVLKEVGGLGQEKLLRSRIAVIGCGGLGSPVLYYLAAAGIGNLIIVDFDEVDLSNLQRQILHFTSDIQKKKTLSASEKISRLNPDVKIQSINEKLLPSNAIELLKGCDFVIDGSDNLQTKMIINDACVHLGIPFTIAGVLRFNGQVITVIPQEKTACYRCIFGDTSHGAPSMSCSQAGVIGLIPGIIGSIQANEAIKHILKIGDLISNRILMVDLLNYHFSFIKVIRDENCMACGDNGQDLLKSYDYNIRDVCYER
ncbi:MAG: ThiF family adenylyltransferase [Promethearchaeota archaeon]